MTRPIHAPARATLGLALVCGLAAGCEGGDDDPCAGVAGACETLNDARCGVEGVEVCVENASGCLVWALSQECGDLQLCETESGTPRCECQDVCDAAGETRCDGVDHVETCAADADGCLAWDRTDDCTGPHEVCDAGGGTAVCLTLCIDDCEVEDATRCDPDTAERIEVCALTEEGCLQWLGTSCGAGTACAWDAATGTASCEYTCDDVCDTADATRCALDVIETCTPGTNGCLDWEATTDCGASSQICSEALAPAACYAPCTDGCTPDTTRCALDVIQTCELGLDGCMAWSATTDCGASSQICSEVLAPAACYAPCADGCADGARQCAADVLQTCELGLDGCLAWTDDDCAATGGHCSDVATPACYPACADACTETATRCDAGRVQACERQANDCTSWVTTTDCAGAGQICSEVLAPAACYPPCANACAADGTTACVGTVITACELQADGCLLEVPGADCADAGQVCSDTSGAAACFDACTDLCLTEGEQRCLDGHSIEACAVQANGCLDWSPALDCRLAVPPTVCDGDPASGYACVPGSGESCLDVGVVDLAAGPFQRSGADLGADFADDHAFGAGAGCDAANGAEAVFAVHLAAGDTLRVAETGGLDAVIRILAACQDGAACELSADAVEDVEYTAAGDGWIFVVFEATSASPAPADYAFTIELLGCQPAPELTWGQCTDGADNDCDGLTDRPADPGCTVCPPPGDPAWAAAEDSDATCFDGLDNDCDGDVDCADSGCAPGGAVTVCFLENTDAACADGIDNDGDGRVDCLQRACAATTTCRPATQEPAENTAALCANGLDDDWSGRADCDDTACKGIGACAAVGAGEETVSCSDGIDNEGDGYVDCVDFGCAADPWCASPEADDDACADGLDNDRDGATDCADAGCYLSPAIAVCADEPETTLERCQDTLDNDWDGLTDCYDPQCAGFAPCVPVAEDTLELCQDGLDNDWDGLVDCDDVSCAAVDPCSASGQPCAVGGWTIVQANSTRSYVIPAGTVIPARGYLVLARQATKATFEAYWGVTLGADVVYLNSVDTVSVSNAVPSINGDENFSIFDGAMGLIDGSTVNMPPDPAGQTIQRVSTDPAPLETSWLRQSASPVSNATPGSSALPAAFVGILISEVSDTTGSGTYYNEFVELRCGGY